MAKGRQPTALFEVIDRGKPLARPPRRNVFKAIAAWFNARRAKGEPGAVMQCVEPAPIDMSAEETALVPGATAPALPRRGLIVDPARREMSLRLSYVSAAIGLVALATALVAAFLIGQKVQGTRPVLTTSTSGQLRDQPPQANLTNLADVPRVSIGENADGDWTDLLPRPGAPVSGDPASATAPRTRTIGLNYVIMQSYPDEKTAKEALKVLSENGLACTVEKALPGWSSANWYTVVGLTGFDRISDNPSYAAYVRKARSISDKFAKKGTFNAFEPSPYKWGKK